MTKKFLVLLLFINLMSVLVLLNPWKKFPNLFHSSSILYPPINSQTANLSPQPTSPPYPTLDSIFTPDHSWTKNLDPSKTVTIIATGDIIPARTVNYEAIQKNDFSWSYKNISDLTKSADLTFVNLETPLIQNCPTTTDGMVFCGDPRHVQGLVMLGADIANLGNNHAGNHGEAGVQETSDILIKNGIEPTGVNGPVYKTIKGVKFAFLGYDDITTPQPGISNVDTDKIKTEIAEAKKNADIVVVQYHWGVEYRDQPDDRQIYLGHLTIDDGADLVIGNHPHWIQPIEFYPASNGASSSYKGKLITYAHGNTIFDQMWSEETKYGVIGKYTFYNKKLADVEYFPLYIKDYGQPSLLEGGEKQTVLNNMKSGSEKLATNAATIKFDTIPNAP